MTKKQWKAYAKDLEVENSIQTLVIENLESQLSTQKEVNNIAVGENYTLNLKLAKLSKEINEFVDYVRRG